MDGRCLPLGAVMVAAGLEAVDAAMDSFEADLASWGNAAIADRFRDRVRARFADELRRAQRVAIRSQIGAAWFRGDGEPCEPGRRLRDLQRDYRTTYPGSPEAGC